MAPNTKADGSDNPEGRQKNRRVEISVAKGAMPAIEKSPPNASSPPPVEKVTIHGTFESFHDVTSRDKQDFVHTKIRLFAEFSAKSIEGNHLKGVAQVSYTKDYAIGGSRCKQAWSTGNISWNADLEGTFEKKSDGGLAVSLLATPKTGPSYRANYTCLNDVTEAAPWPGVGGTLVKGRYDMRIDFPVSGRGSVTGQAYQTIHMELAPYK